MIQKMSHAVIYVNDQESALEFYTEKLGFDIRTDITMEGYRWVTIGPVDQPDLEIVLMPLVASEMVDEETVNHMRSILEKGAMGTGVFQTDDCQATYEQLKAKGVEFIAPPQERPYGVEALIKDNQGNWFSLMQPRAFDHNAK